MTGISEFNTSYFDIGGPGDTIAALSTQPGTAAIAVIRISGNLSLDILKKIFLPASGAFPPEPRKMTLGIILKPDEDRSLDQSMIAFYPSPDSYTGEDVVEIFSHGGQLVTREILTTIFSLGARPASRGEFTCRAFMNRKLDLSQAEAVLEVIQARNKEFLNASLRRLSGSVANPVRKLRKTLVDLLASIEVAIDYPDDNTPQLSPDTLISNVGNVRKELVRILDNSKSVRITNEGFKVVIVGKPNVGKSSLVNRILGKERVIVSDIPGTTRDFVGDWFSTAGQDFLILDTAGITISQDPIETEGIKRTLDCIEGADLAIALFDSSKEFSSDDEKVILAAKKAPFSIPVLSKSDLETFIDCSKISISWPGETIINASSLTGLGIDILISSISSLFDTHSNIPPDIILLNIRQHDLIQKTLFSLDNLIINAGIVSDDILSIDLRESISFLGQITGEDTTVDIMNSIFSNFCVGK